MADQEDPVIAGLVQKLIAENASDEDIRAVIQEHKKQTATKQNFDAMNLSKLGGKQTDQFKLPSQDYNEIPAAKIPNRQERLTEKLTEGKTPEQQQRLRDEFAKNPGQTWQEGLPELGAAAVGLAMEYGSGGMATPAVPAATAATRTGLTRLITNPRVLNAVRQGVGQGGGAYLGARAAGQSRDDAASTGLTTGALAATVPAAVEGAVNAVSKVGPAVTQFGRQLGRSYLKPTLAAGKAEAQRLFGRGDMASQANEKVVDRILERNILGSDNPEMAISNAIQEAENKLQALIQGPIGDRPTRLNDLLRTVFQRGHKAATESAHNIPGAQDTIDEAIKGTLTGRLGGKLDYGTPRPPPRGETLSAQPIVEAMRGTQASPGVPTPQAPQLANPLQRIETQGRTQIMREAPPGSQTGSLIGRNFTPPVHAAPTTMPLVASHRPQPPTVREAHEFARRSGKDLDWNKAPSDLIDWFRRQENSAARTSMKDAAEELRPILSELGELLSAKRVVPQTMNREANKNTIGRLPAMLAALGATATGHPIKGGALALGGVGLMDRNAGQIAQQVYNMGKMLERRMPGISPEMAQELGKRVWQAALMQQLQPDSEQK